MIRSTYRLTKIKDGSKTSFCPKTRSISKTSGRYSRMAQPVGISWSSKLQRQSRKVLSQWSQAMLKSTQKSSLEPPRREESTRPISTKFCRCWATWAVSWISLWLSECSSRLDTSRGSSHGLFSAMRTRSRVTPRTTRSSIRATQRETVSKRCASQSCKSQNLKVAKRNPRTVTSS